MYSEGQMQGIFILTAIPSFSMTTVKGGYEPRYKIMMRLAEHLLEPVSRSLTAMNIHHVMIRERGRRVDSIIVRRRFDILRVCDLMPDSPTKSKSWRKFKRVMNMVRNGEHLEEDSKYRFERVLNEDEDEQTILSSR
tara:strand:+ start:1219 stop:1629 length:411 start_codon:yes stop_codon:yes gene_type:complete